MKKTNDAMTNAAMMIMQHETRKNGKRTKSAVRVLLSALLMVGTAGVLLAADACADTAVTAEAGETSDYDDQVTVEVVRDYDYASQVFEMVNEQRESNGLAALTFDAELTGMAMQRAAECAVYFSHTRPNGTLCLSMSERIWGENIAVGQTSPEWVMDSWMNSEGHRANILGSGYKSIGIGCVKVGAVYYWAQEFGADCTSDSVKSGTEKAVYTVDVSYDVLSSFDMEFNRNMQTTDTVELAPYASYQLEADARNAGFGEVYGIIASSCLTWTSSDPSVCTVSADGVVTAGSNVGTATITATTKGGRSCSQTFTVACAYGDVDGNGRLEASDALAILGYVAGLSDSGNDAAVPALADTNRDGTVTAADALMVLKRAVGLETPN